MRYGNPSCLTSITNEQLVLNGTHSLKTARSMNSFTKLGRIEAACLYLENAHGVRKIPMGRTFYWKTCLWKANHKKHLCYGAVGTWKNAGLLTWNDCGYMAWTRSATLRIKSRGSKRLYLNKKIRWIEPFIFFIIYTTLCISVQLEASSWTESG